MTIRFLCPMGHRLAVPDERAGKKGRCPICNQRVYVPRPDPLAAKAAKHGRPETAPSSSPLADDAAALDEPDEIVPWDESPLGQAQAALPPPAAAPEAAAPPAPGTTIARPAPPLTLEELLGPSKRDSPQASQTAPPAPGESIPILDSPFGTPAETIPAKTLPPLAPAPSGVPAAVPLPPEAALSEPAVATLPEPASPIPLPAAAVSAPPPPALPLAPSVSPAAPVALLPAVVDGPKPLEGYQADPGKVQTVYMLAAALAALTIFAAVPALKHLNFTDAPGWARAVLILSALQLVYVVWMVSLPDWSTVYIGMIVFAMVSAAYGVAWALVAFTPEARPINFLDLDSVRRSAAGWCLVVLLLGALCTYACGRFSGRWRREFELAKSRRAEA